MIGGIVTTTSACSDTNFTNELGHNIAYDSVDGQRNAYNLNLVETGTSDKDKPETNKLQTTIQG